jgi:hypothetical protein
MTMTYASWMHGPNSAGMSSKSCTNRLRRVSYTYNLAGVLDLDAFEAFAARLLTSRTWGRG